MNSQDRQRLLFWVAVCLTTYWFALGRAALAHDGGGSELAAGGWTGALPLWAGVLVTGLLYGRAVQTVWSRAGRARVVSYGQVAGFTLGLVAILVALASPLDAYSDDLLSAHMIQHLLLLVVAPPLLIWGAPPVIWMWLLRPARRRKVGAWWQRSALRRAAGWLQRPLLVWALYAVTLWLWHTPALYEAAIRQEWVHILEHTAFLGTALLFWWVLAQPGRRGPVSYGVAILFIFTTALHSTFLGVLMTFARVPWYPVYAESSGVWGLTPLADQQLAGALMWVPGGIIFLLAALVLLYTWFQAMERQERRMPL